MLPRARNSLVAVLLIQIFIAVTCVEGKHWAFLVAGSKGWINYRHQADLCHAYQLLRAHGIPQDNIITMFVDDIAYDKKNPHKGVVINKPNGPNVYKGISKDYTGQDVNVKNLINVLKGDKGAMEGIGSGRVIDSGPGDTIFINIIDHGSPGSISINGGYLYADQFNDALKYLKEKNRYAKILIYVETCESGSMFDNILDDRSFIFAMTAANPDESSFVRYYSDELDTYIGDAFSTIWMEDIDKERQVSNSASKTLFKEYEYVRAKVNTSHVQIYGDSRLRNDKTSLYMGNKQGLLQKIKPMPEILLEQTDDGASLVPSEEVQIELLRKKLSKAKSEMERASLKKEINQVIQGRALVDNIIDMSLKRLSGDNSRLYTYLTTAKNSPNLGVFPCYREIVETFDRHCLKTHENPYVTRHFHKFINVCMKGINAFNFGNIVKDVCPDNLQLSLKNLL